MLTTNLRPLILLLCLTLAAATAPAQQAPADDGTADGVTTEETAFVDAEPAAVAGPARRLAETTRDAAEGLVVQVKEILADFSRDRAGGPPIDWSAVATATALLALLAGTVFAVLWLLRLAVRYLRGSLQRWVLADDGGGRLLRRVAALAAGAALEALAIVAAWVAGYAVALFAVGESGTMADRQSLFLNAFLVVEIVKATLRLGLAPRHEGLRPLPLDTSAAAYLNGWLARIAELLGYGLMLIVPLANVTLDTAFGDLVRLVVYLGSFGLAATLILSNRRGVRDYLDGRARSSDNSAIRLVAAILARTWHVLLIAYLGIGLAVALSSPETALPFMASATLQTLLIVAAAVFVSAAIGHLGAALVRPAAGVTRRLPGVESRLRTLLPRTLTTLRVIIAVVAAALVLDAWRIASVGAWLASEAGAETLATMLSVALILLGASILWIAVAGWIEYRLDPDSGSGAPAARQKTLLVLFRNGISIVIVTMTLMIVLSELGINIGPLIAGAGVLGLAIGFGAQTMVRDVITGVFIQLEDAIYTGDVVTVAGVTGAVERVTIRSVGIRDLSGTLHVVPFSSVDTVSNFTRGFSYHLGVYGVAYRENTDEVIEHLRAAFEELRGDAAHADKILGDLEVHGVTEFGDNAVNIRIRIKTEPGAQWPVGRAYNRLVKQHFDAAGIEIPFPHTTLYFGEDKDGGAPAANVRLLGAPAGANGGEG